MRGPTLLLLSLGLWAALDTNSKLLSGGYHVSQVLAFRYAVLLALLAAAAGVGMVRLAGPRGVATRRPAAQLLRAALAVGSGAGFFLSLRHLPMAEGYLVYFTAPFMLLGLSRLILGEAVPGRAWAWCGVGFLGVLAALLPRLSGGEAPLEAYGWGLFGSFCHASIMVLNRSLRDEPGVARLLLWTAAPTLPFLLPWAAAEWSTPSPWDALALAANGALGGAAMVGLAAAFRHAGAGRLAPLEFSALLFAVAADVLVWGIWPPAAVWAGAVIVVFAGVMAQRRPGPGGGGKAAGI